MAVSSLQVEAVADQVITFMSIVAIVNIARPVCVTKRSCAISFVSTRLFMLAALFTAAVGLVDIAATCKQ